MKRGLGIALVALLVISLVISACAPALPVEVPAPTKAPGAAKPAAEATAPAAAKAPIRIGYITTLTGSSGGAGIDMKDAFAMYLQERGGSLAGRKIELIAEDDEQNPQTALVKAKKLVERDNVHMLVGISNSGVAYAIANYVKGSKIPLLLNNAGADDLTQRQFSPYIFRNGYANSQMHYPLGEWAYKNGYRKAAIIAADYAAGYEGVGGFARTFTEAGGRVIQEQYKALGAPDPAPYITAINPDADVVFGYQFASDAMRFVPAYEQFGMKKRVPLIGTSGLVDEMVRPQQGDSALGVVAVQIWTAALDNPANKALVAAFQKTYGRDINFPSVLSYEGAMIIDKALQGVKGNIEDTEGFMKALETVEIPDGPRGPFKFDKYHNGIINLYIAEIGKVGDKMTSVVRDTYKEVSQFWRWNPDDYMKMPAYADMKGKWAK